MDVDKAPAAADADATTSDAAAADPASGDGTLHDQEEAETAKTEEETDKEPGMVRADWDAFRGALSQAIHG